MSKRALGGGARFQHPEHGACEVLVGAAQLGWAPLRVGGRLDPDGLAVGKR